MRLTFVLPTFSFYPIGGYGVVYEYATRLSRRGLTVTVAHVVPFHFPRRDAFLGDIAAMVGYQRPIRRHLAWANVDPDVRLATISSPDASLLPDADGTILTAWQTAARFAPGLESRHGRAFNLVYDYEFWMAAEGAKRQEIEQALSEPDVTRVATSGAVAGMLRSMGSDYAAIVNAGIDNDKWQYEIPVTSRERKIVFPLRSGATKGTAYMLEAASAIASAHPDWTIESFGPGRMSVPSAVHHHGVISNGALRRLYNEAAIFVLPSVYEGWGLPAIEAMACGAAVISTANGGAEDFCIDSHNSLVIPPAGSPQIVEAVDLLIRDAALRQRLALAGTETALTFSWDRAADSFAEVLLASPADRVDR